MELLFADIYRATEATAYQLGRDGGVQSDGNRFRLLCNGRLLDEQAPGETNGNFNAVRRKYMVRNDGDHLSLRFETLSGKCYLNGIKIRKIQ